MIVCVCRAVSHRTILEVIDEGAHSVEAIGEACGAGTDCGSCHCDLEAMRDAVCSGKVRLSEAPGAFTAGVAAGLACHAEANVVSESTQASRKIA